MRKVKIFSFIFISVTFFALSVTYAENIDRFDKVSIKNEIENQSAYYEDIFKKIVKLERGFNANIEKKKALKYISKQLGIEEVEKIVFKIDNSFHPDIYYVVYGKGKRVPDSCLYSQNILFIDTNEIVKNKKKEERRGCLNYKGLFSCKEKLSKRMYINFEYNDYSYKIYTEIKNYKIECEALIDLFLSLKEGRYHSSNIDKEKIESFKWDNLNIVSNNPNHFIVTGNVTETARYSVEIERKFKQYHILHYILSES